MLIWSELWCFRTSYLTLNGSILTAHTGIYGLTRGETVHPWRTEHPLHTVIPIKTWRLENCGTEAHNLDSFFTYKHVLAGFFSCGPNNKMNGAYQAALWSLVGSTLRTLLESLTAHRLTISSANPLNLVFLLFINQNSVIQLLFTPETCLRTGRAVTSNVESLKARGSFPEAVMPGP